MNGLTDRQQIVLRFSDTDLPSFKTLQKGSGQAVKESLAWEMSHGASGA